MGRVNLKDIKNKMNTNVSDLFTTEETRKNGEKKQIKMILLKELDSFENHPFNVVDDDKMEEIKNSIKENGVLVPIIVRKKENDNNKYEIIAGHRRTRASQLLELEEIPAIITEFDDEQSVIAMVDSNIQRETLLFSEKAFAYKMKIEAIKKNINKLKEEEKTSDLGKGKVITDLVGEEAGESGRQIKRYIRLTYLIKPLLDLVDEKKIAFLTGVEISYLSKDEQNMLFEKMIEINASLSMAQATELKKYSNSDGLTLDLIESILNKNVKKSKSLVLKEDEIKKYFPKEYSIEDMEDIIIMLLEDWKGTV